MPRLTANLCAFAAVASPPAELPAEMATPPSMQGLADTYAVVDIGGVQHIVEEGRWYTCNRLAVSFLCSHTSRPMFAAYMHPSHPSAMAACGG